jgi:hypothetical protein
MQLMGESGDWAADRVGRGSDDVHLALTEFKLGVCEWAGYSKASQN